MPTIEDQLQKKKPFKKKAFRSYLSLDETVDDLSPNSQQNPSITDQHTVNSTVSANSAVPADSTDTVELAVSAETAVPATLTVTADMTGTVDSAVSKKRGLKTQKQPTAADGYSRISHRILETLYMADLNPRQYRVLLFIIRKSLGWSQEEVELSTKDLAEGIGIDSAAIWRAIPGLIEEGYLLKKEGTNQKNIYSLNSKKFGRLLPVKSTLTADSTVPVDSTVEGTADLTVGGYCQLDSTSPYRKKEVKERLNKSLSLVDFFENYFSEIRAPLAEKEEREAFFKIRERNKDVTDIEFLECFDLVSNDRDAKGNPITFRFAWMAKGFDKILKRARTNLIAKRRLDEDNARALAEHQSREEQEKKEAERESKMSQEEIATLIEKNLTTSLSSATKPSGKIEMTPDEMAARIQFLREQAQILNAGTGIL